jgi:DNA-binding CsgD family transcriptional regulator
MTLAARDYERMLDFVVAAMARIDEAAPVWPGVCTELAAAFDASLSGVISVPWPDGTTHQSLVWPPWAQRIESTPAESVAHPLVRHYALRRDAEPRALQDVGDGLRWRTANRYAPMRARFADAPEHLGIPLDRRAGRVRFVGLGRAGRRFGDREHGYARRVHPVLVALDRHEATISRWRSPAGQPAAGRLADAGVTPRELAVLTLLADGLTVAAVARRLGISPRTVAKHQENLQRKLHARDRLALVLNAQRLGLVRTPATRQA